MAVSVGKTIARIEERPTDPEHGYQRDDTLLLHFTDGTALKIIGSSYEEVSLDWDEIDSGEVARLGRAAQGRREEARLQRLRRQEFDALSGEEKTKRRDARLARMTPFQRTMEGCLQSLAVDMLRDFNRQSFATDPVTMTLPVQKRKRARRS